jgi:hypothetical protein
VEELPAAEANLITNDGPATGEPLITWDSQIRVLGDASVWSSMLMAVGIPSVLFGVFVAVITKQPEYAAYVPLAFTSAVFTIFIIVGAVIDLFGGFRVTFVLTRDGVGSLSGKGAKAVSTAAFAVGVLGGSVGALRAGRMAKSEQNVFIPWKAITNIRINPRRRTILIRGGWLDKPISLYCEAANIAAVTAIVRDHAGAAFAGWPTTPSRSRPAPEG